MNLSTYVKLHPQIRNDDLVIRDQRNRLSAKERISCCNGQEIPIPNEMEDFLQSNGSLLDGIDD